MSSILIEVSVNVQWNVFESDVLEFVLLSLIPFSWFLETFNCWAVHDAKINQTNGQLRLRAGLVTHCEIIRDYKISSHPLKKEWSTLS